MTPPAEVPWSDRVFALWCRYYAETEAFDRELPHRLVNGQCIVHFDFRAVSDKHAREVRQRLFPGGPATGDERHEFNAAKRKAAFLAFEQQQLHSATDAQVLEWGGAPMSALSHSGRIFA